MFKFSRLFVIAFFGLVMVGGVALLAETEQQKRLTVEETLAIWQQRASEETPKERVNPWSKDQNTQPLAAGPNALVHGAAPSPPGENNNSSVAWDERFLGEVYTIYNEYPAPGLVPSLIGSAGSPAGGVPGSWVNFGPAPPGPFPAEFNGTISSNPVGGYIMAGVGYAAVPPYMGPGGIIMDISAGAGAPFVGSVGPVMAAGGLPGGDWVDFPHMLMDDVPGNPAPGFGTGHMAWVHYLDLDGDPDGDGNPFNDADSYEIMYAYSNTLGGPFPYPAASPPIALSPLLPVNKGVHSDHRPALAVVGPPGTPVVGMPPGAVYCAWYDPMGGGIWVDASPAPGAGAPWGVLPPGPVIPTGPPTVPVIPNGPPTMASSGVSMMISWGALCPGAIYICWSDASLGTSDIWFTSSFDGGATWLLPVRVNCDPPGGAEQWAPKMTMNQITGEILIVYNDQRGAPGAGTEQWASVSSDCGATWTDALVSDKGPIPAITSIFGPPGPAGSAWIGDYIGADFAISTPTIYGMTFNDGRNGADQDVQFESILDIDADCDGFPVSIDCDDTNPLVYPGATEILCDGLDNDCSILTPDDIDADGDGVSVCAGDCDDADPNTFPGNPEVCDGADNDCNTLIDDGLIFTTYYPDNDGDGFGDATDPGTSTCSGPPPGYVPDNTDCDDSDANVNPGATEVCDGADNDCDGVVDNGFDLDGDSWTTCAGDCDDGNAAVNPAASEVTCNGLDDDCNAGTPDDVDADGDGISVCAGDCDDSDPNIFPGNVEVCDGVDNDCDGVVDNGFDLDGDGWTTCAGDCNDGNAAINPGAPENCSNTIDDDCDGLVDLADPNCAPPTNLVHPGAIGLDQNNASVALSETIGGHVYVSFNEFLGPGPGAVPTVTGHSWSAAGGAPGTWTYLGPVPPGVLPENINATISGHHLGGYFMADVGYGLPQYVGPSVIQLRGSAGGGAPFIPPGPPIFAALPGQTWVDFPYLEMQEDPAMPLPDLGTGHIAWVEYIDGDGDPNGDLNIVNDPGDAYQIWYSFSNTLAGPFIWPVASPPTLIQPPLAVTPLQHQTHRPAVDVVNTSSAVHYPPGAVYIAWTDGFRIFLDVNPAPVAFAPWTGPASVLAIGAPVPPVIVPGVAINASSSVALTVDDGPNCPGNVYIAWSDYVLGDADIWFSLSADGGLTWIAPIRVNCDAPGTGAEQWAPQMRVDPVNGDICIVYYDTRTAPAVGVETFASVSSDCGSTWSDHPVSLVGPTPPVNLLPNPPGPAGGSFAGDYLGLDINATNRVGMAWNDGRNGADEDVFYATTKQANACGCCVVAGDADGGGSITIGDVTYLIAYIFSGGPPPSCCEEGDADGNGSITIGDVTYLIARIFSGGPPPVCGPAGMSCTGR